jgi:hypothetical protein
MLVLAMEFSRGAQRGYGTTEAKKQTGDRVRYARASGHGSPNGTDDFASEGRNRPGLPNEQDPEVTPSKRNSDAHRHRQSPQA